MTVMALVNAKLANANGEAGLTVDPKCRDLVRDFEETFYKPESSVIDKERDPFRTHLSDALGYLIWEECRPKGTHGEQPNPIS